MKILPRPDKKKEWCHLYCRACGLLIFLGVIGVIVSATFFGLCRGGSFEEKLRYKTVTKDLFDTNLFLCLAMAISKLVIIYAMLRRSIPAND